MVRSDVHLIRLSLSHHRIGSFVAPVLASSERRPFEGELAGATLWPEIEKIFGHGYEVCSNRMNDSDFSLATPIVRSQYRWQSLIRAN
jgi:hypothetical protein